MRIKKQIYRSKDSIELDLEKIKDYGRYTLYQVYRIDGEKRTPLYKESFTDAQIREIVLNDYSIIEEDFK